MYLLFNPWQHYIKPEPKIKVKTEMAIAFPYETVFPVTPSFAFHFMPKKL